LLGGCGEKMFSFVRDGLRPITFGGKSTRDSVQLQAQAEECRNRQPAVFPRLLSCTPTDQ